MTRIKDLRRMSGETQESMATLVGITRGAYANIENGKREPDIKTMTILANHFDVTIGYLLGLDEKENPAPDDGDGPDRNVIKIAGRDGSFIERELTDEQISALKLMLDQFPKVGDL